MNQSELIGRVVERNEQSWIVIGESKRRFKLVNLDANAERPVATTLLNEKLKITHMRCKGFLFKKEQSLRRACHLSNRDYSAIIFLPDGRVIDSDNYRNKPTRKLFTSNSNGYIRETILDLKQGKTSNKHYHLIKCL
jgi:hypothetical protein